MLKTLSLIGKLLLKNLGGRWNVTGNQFSLPGFKSMGPEETGDAEGAIIFVVPGAPDNV